MNLNLTITDMVSFKKLGSDIPFSLLEDLLCNWFGENVEKLNKILLINKLNSINEEKKKLGKCMVCGTKKFFKWDK